MNATPDNPLCEHCGSSLVHHRYDPHIHMECPDGFRRRVEDMPRIGVAPRPDVPLGEYRHYKGGSYLVIGGVLDDDTQEVRVLYVSCEHGYVGPARTVQDFTGVVQWPGGHTGPRFMKSIDWTEAEFG